ncbi:MAG: hypothetical protein U0Y10_26315 [Spirosomataceae bacterium]
MKARWVFVLMFLPMIGFSQEITIYTFIPASPINFETPRRAFFTRLRNTVSFRHPIRSHPVGHLVVELRYDSLREVSGYSANEMFSVYKSYLLQGIGLGVLFMPVPARIESLERNAAQLLRRQKTGRMAYLRFKVSPQAFDRVWHYMKAYRQRPSAQYLILPSDPQHDTTAYCSSFAMSFLDVAGIGTAFRERWLADSVWTTDFNVPEDLIGRPFNNRKVGLFTLLLKGGHWAQAGTPTRSIRLLNPSLLFEWIETNWYFYQTNPSSHIVPEKQRRAKGLLLDYSGVR